MAKTINAVRKYSPRVELGEMVEVLELVKLISGRTSINEGAILNMFSEIREAITFFATMGRPMRLQGVGIFAPRVERDGTFSINFKVDSRLKSEINVPGKFSGRMANRGMIGKSNDELIDIWNEENPGDKIKPRKEK